MPEARTSKSKARIIGVLSNMASLQHSVIPLFMVMTLVIIIYPLPALMMDFLLGINIMLSLLLLLSCIYIEKPNEMSCFPSLLMILTLYRLSLNVASTRLILTKAPVDKERAAGDIIFAFGDFVTGAGGEKFGLVVGLVLFIILIVIQFMVITKGATRIAEVAARFTLDAMPGHQMAIDADLNAGIIDENEARTRREEIRQRADFYGAMDGASKFVRGDTIAGIIITLVNIGAGFIIGVAMGDMSFAEAGQVFTKLTIGDGLVGQVPALLISIGSGLLVTRGGQKNDFGGEIINQLMNHRRALGLGSVLMAGLGLSGIVFTPFPPVPLLCIAAACGAWWWNLGRSGDAKAKAAEAEKAEKAEKDAAPKEERVEDFLKIDPMELEVGYGLVPLVDVSQAESGGGGLLQRVSMIRQQMAQELGIIVPPIRIRDNMQLEPNEYIIKIQGDPVAHDKIEPERYLAMDVGAVTAPVNGIETTEPAFGMPAVWITESQREKAEQNGYAVVDAETVVATHLTEIVRSRSHELLTSEEVTRLLDNVKESMPNLVQGVTPQPLTVFDIQKVLQNLLRERVSIRNLPAFLEVMAEIGRRTTDPEIITAHCRNKIARQICNDYAENNTLHVITLDPGLEDIIGKRVEHSESGSFLSLRPDSQQIVIDAIATQVQEQLQSGHAALVLTGPQIRLQIKRMTESALPTLGVISYNEVLSEFKVESVGMVKAEL